MNNQNQNKCLVDFYGRTKFIYPIDFNCRIHSLSHTLRGTSSRAVVGLFLCVQQAACRNIYNNAATHSLTHAKLVLVFSRPVDLLHIEWFWNLPLERINDTVNHMKVDAKTYAHNDSNTGRRSNHAWRHNWNSHSAFVGQSERARGTKRFV